MRTPAGTVNLKGTGLPTPNTKSVNTVPSSGHMDFTLRKCCHYICSRVLNDKETFPEAEESTLFARQLFSFLIHFSCLQHQHQTAVITHSTSGPLETLKYALLGPGDICDLCSLLSLLLLCSFYFLSGYFCFSPLFSLLM